MARYMAFGTYPEPLAAAVIGAIDFHEKVGAVRKADRIRFLTRYWREQVERLPGVRFYTTSDPGHSCGLGVFEIAGIDSHAMRNHLRDRHGIIVRTMQEEARVPEIRGVRVAAGLYTSTSDLDRFGAAIKQVSQRGV